MSGNVTLSEERYLDFRQLVLEEGAIFLGMLKYLLKKK